MNKVVKNMQCLIIRKYWLLIILLVVCVVESNGSVLDSLISALPSSKNDSHRVMLLRDISWELQSINPDSSIAYANAAYEIAVQIDHDYCTAKAKGQVANAMYFAGMKEEAISAYAECARMHGRIKDTLAMAAINSNIGSLLFGSQEYEDALLYFRLAYSSVVGRNVKEEANYLANIGGALVHLGQYDSARVYLELVLTKELRGFNRAIAQDNLGIAILNTDSALTSLDSALALHIRASNFFKENGYFESEFFALSNAAVVYNTMDQPYKASVILDSIWTLLPHINDWEGIANVYNTAFHTYLKLGDYVSAKKYHKLMRSALSSWHQEQANASLRDAERKYHTDQVRQQNKIQELTIANEKAENKKKQNYIYFALGGVLLLGALAFLLFRGNRIKQKANEELSEANDQINHQKNIIEEKNRDITDSINYARFIQSSILPDTSGLGKYFNDHFVYYQPRDIVSGDFYWVSEQDDHIYVSASDCTGHGVPGGFVSMLCSSALTQSITENSELAPNELLTRVNQNVLRVLAKDGQSDSVKDGMDSALIRFNKNSGKIEFAGAQRPIIRVRKGEEPVRVRGDKNPIGGWTPADQPFTLHELDVQPGDHLYMFSDGYADQFGGPKLKKFMIGRLRALFEEMVNIDLTMQEQHNLLHSRLNDWKGEQEQIDDVLVVGLKV